MVGILEKSLNVVQTFHRRKSCNKALSLHSALEVQNSIFYLYLKWFWLSSKGQNQNCLWNPFEEKSVLEALKLKDPPWNQSFRTFKVVILLVYLLWHYTIFSPWLVCKRYTHILCTPLHTFIVSTRSSIMIHALRPKFICRMCLAAAKSSSQYWYIELYIYHNGPDQPNFVHFWSRQSDNDLVLL